MDYCDVCGKPQGFGRCEHCAERERHRIAEMDVARRLARYDEAIRLLRLCADEGSPFRLESEEIPAFLAAEPVGEMPEAVKNAVEWLRSEARSWADDAPTAAGITRSHADALESWWRSQPAPAVAMTEELRNLLIFVDGTCSLRCDEGWRPETLEAMKKTANAVRAQASQPQRVELGRVRAYFQSLSLLPQYDNAEGREFLARMFVEIDAAEGKVTG
jgi:hypothetical protein